jgi:hypothetical protein
MHDVAYIHKFLYRFCQRRYLYIRKIPKLIRSAILNPLTPNDLYNRRAVSPLKIRIPSKKNMHENPTNAPIIHLVY